MLGLERFLLDLVNVCNGHSFHYVLRHYIEIYLTAIFNFKVWGLLRVTKQSNSLYCFQFASSFVVSYEMLKEN